MMVVDGGGGGGGFVLGYIFCNTWVIDEVPYICMYIYSHLHCATNFVILLHYKQLVMHTYYCHITFIYYHLVKEDELYWHDVNTLTGHSYDGSVTVTQITLS